MTFEDRTVDVELYNGTVMEDQPLAEIISFEGYPHERWEKQDSSFDDWHTWFLDGSHEVQVILSETDEGWQPLCYEGEADVGRYPIAEPMSPTDAASTASGFMIDLESAYNLGDGPIGQGYVTA